MKLNMLKLLKITSRNLYQSKDQLLAVVGSGSLVSTVIFAISGQRKADKEIEEINKNLAVNDEEPLTAREEVGVSVKHHVGTLIGTGVTIYCIWRGYLNGQDYKAQLVEMTGAYGLLSKSYDDLQKAIEETGHKDEIKDKVLDNVYQEKKDEIMAENEHPHDSSEAWFIEEVTGQGWWDTLENVKAGINKVNYEMNVSNGYAQASMDDLLSQFGLRKMGGELGSRIGWDINYTGIIDPKFYRPDPADDDPYKNVWVVGYFNPPKENFGRSYY
jgi:hypothetical protein